jgi:biopolymer transport protein TolQ
VAADTTPPRTQWHDDCVQCETVEILRFFVQTGWVAKVVLVTLLFFSLASWSVILAKWRELGSAQRTSERFVRVFRKATRLNEAAEVAPRHRSSPLAAIFQAGYSELEASIRAARRAAGPDTPLRVRTLDGVSRALERAVGSEQERLQRALPMLATTASVTPFIGLFGTVWGIMNTFHAIGVTGSTSIVTVAPGIAEALVNTAAGLLAAIPAVIAYNHLLARVRQLRRRMDDFSLEFLNLVDRNFM